MGGIGGGAVMGGMAGAGGTGGAAGGIGGRAGTGGPGGAMGMGGKGGAFAAGGATGSAGTVGTAGAGGRGGSSGVTGTGGTTGAAGATGIGGAAGAGPCGGIYCDNFESDTVGTMPSGWTRVGGSDGDWGVDTGKALAQDHAQSSTFRLCYASAAAGAPWSGSTSVSAQVKVLLAGSSGATDALVCVRYTVGGDYHCLVLEPGIGAHVRTRSGGATTDGAVWPATLAIGTSVSVKLSMDAAGMLSAFLNGKFLGTTAPLGVVASGFVAVATQSAEAAFDDIVVAQP